MALKDWKKVGINNWSHKIENKHISINKVKYGQFANQFSVFWTSNMSLRKQYTGSVFKTKKGALNLVKYLMKTN